MFDLAQISTSTAMALARMAIAFSPSAPLVSPRLTARRASPNVCKCQAAGSVRAASAACAALLAAHALSIPAVALAPPPAHAAAETATASVAAPAEESANAPPVEETPKEARARSIRNTRTSGASSRLFSSAQRAAAAGDLQSAEFLYTELTETAPTFAPGFSNLGNILVARKSYAPAIERYSRALELAPAARDSWLIHVNRGAALLASGDARAALDDMNAADALEPKQAAILSNRGVVWEALKKYDNAARDYQNALDGNDVQPFWLRYGLVLFQKGMSFEALSVINRVNARFGGDDAAAAQAVVYFDRNDLGAAESAWSRVERPRLYETTEFLAGERKWPPKAVEAMQRFRGAN